MAAVVEVKLYLGHKAKVRDYPSPKGHTHDWVVFVKGADNIKLEHFVEKVVFWLHEDYEPSKKVFKREPYAVEESGFAGFIILIDIHFKNRQEPKMVRFQYDLFLYMEGMPPVYHERLEKLSFTNPTEDFRRKLLKAGALLIPAPSSSLHSSKECSSRTSSSPPSKKERSRSKDNSKHRDGSSSSSHRTHDEKKRSNSAHSVKKDVRLPGKEMKKHEEFKHPKPPDLQRTHKDSSGSEKIEHERGRPEKRRSVADDDGNKRKKKKHSDDRQSPSQQSRPKSLGITPVPVPQNLVRKEKEKVRKIHEKPDIMAGLFAPENSINMTQVKQSKEKVKVEATVKKDKKSTSNTTPASRSVSPHPGKEEPKITHSSKVSPGGNLTLKIKKERITSAEKEKKDAPNKPIKSKKKESSEKEKRHSKESSESQSKSRMKDRNPEPKRRTSITSSDSSSSSSSGSDMDISSDSDSLPDKSERKRKMTTNSSIKTQKVEHKSKPQVRNKEHQRMIEKAENRMQNSNGNQGKFEKIKTERERPKDSPKTIASTERHEKPRRNSSSQQEKRMSSSSSKQKKSSRDERVNVSLDKSTSESSSIHKSKKLKRSSKEKSVREPSKERKISTPTAPPPPLVKKEKRVSTPGSTPKTERMSVKKEQAYQTPPPSSNRGSVSPPQSIKSKKLPKPPSAPSKEKEKKSRKQQHSTEKSKKSVSSAPSRKQSLISTPKQEEEPEKPKITYKSRSFVETSSDSDSDIEPPMVKTAPQNFNKISENSRKDSISSQSSSSSQDSHPHMSPEVDKNTHPDPHQENHHSPAKIEENSPPTSCSESSDEEERAMRDFPPNTSALTVISPIRDQSPVYNNSIENPSDTGTATAYQDMEMSESSDDDPEPHPPPVQVKVKEHPPPAWKEENHPHPLHHIGGITSDEYASSDEDSRSPPEKPFQYLQDDHDENAAQSSASEKPRAVITLAGENGHFPRMTEKFYNQLQELQKRISYETDVERLRNIACIVAKSQKLLKNDDYFDFDLCSLDQRTIRKIQQQLSAK